MDRLHTQELRRLSDELNSTLTPKQRQLAVVSALKPEMLNADQQRILKQMEPYLEGLSFEQARQLAITDVIAEGYEKGQRDGAALVKVFVGIVVLVVLLVLLLVLQR